MISRLERLSLVPSMMAVIVVGALLGGLAGLGVVRAQPTPLSSEDYFFDAWEPGHTYRAQFTRYKRYGPMKDAIESRSNLLLGPETATTDAVLEIDESGKIRNVEFTVTSSTGEKWYTYSSPEADRYLVTDHQANKQIDGPSIPPQALLTNQQARPHYARILEQLGWQSVGEGSFNSRQTLVYSLVEPAERQQEPPADSECKSPVMYDLNPASFRYEAQVDLLSGVILQSSRYAVDALGEETLIESFDLIMVRQED